MMIVTFGHLLQVLIMNFTPSHPLRILALVLSDYLTQILALVTFGHLTHILDLVTTGHLIKI